MLVMWLMAFAAITAMTPPQLVPAQTVTAPTVVVRTDDDVLRGSLSRALVDEGAAVTDDDAVATHEITVAAKDDGGFVLTCTGADSHGASLAAAPHALLVLELQHRAVALLRQTRGRAPEAGVGDEPVRVAVQLVDRGDVGQGFGERFIAALVDAGVVLVAAGDARELLCVVAAPDVVVLSWGAGHACDGRPVAVRRRDLSAPVAVSEALRLRDAAPLPVTMTRPEPGALPAPSKTSPAPLAAPTTTTHPTPTTTTPAGPGTTMVPSSTEARVAPAAAAARQANDTHANAAAPAITATTTHANERAPWRDTRATLAVRAGALARVLAVDPLLEVSAAVPLIAGVGPLVVVDASTGLAPLFIGEALTAVGAGGAWHVSDDVRVSVGLAGGVWVHGWRFDDTDAGLTLDPALAIPAAMDVRVGDGLALSLGLTAGAMTRSRIHKIGGAEVWSRGPLFLAFSAGVAFDLLPPRAATENGGGLARGSSE